MENNKSNKKTYCVRCEEWVRKQEDICYREWEGDSDAPMCAWCWDQTEIEEDEAEE